ncbi:MAG: hypothetical protein ABJF11_18740 [Reichenbachiella sp.]|uniref:HEAT repeat domain-containing protein n=1 Tax=Reichenbachiella sp. TaxID=2184521 RepID=UPI003265B3F8
METLSTIWRESTSYYELCALFFAGSSGLIILGITLNRQVSRWKRSKLLRPHNLIKNSLNTIAALAPDIEEYATEIQEAQQHLQQVTQRSPGLAQFVIDRLIELHKNLSGISARVLKKVYDDLHLYRVSKQKLMNGNYATVIKGIQELAEMRRHEDIESIVGFLDYYHELVRLETRVALISLIPEDPLICLKSMKDPLTKWEEILIYNKLRKLSPEQVPAFKAYFDHTNPTVICYCINMAARFLQYDAIDLMTRLIFHKNDAISWQAVNALKMLEADQAANFILLLLQKTKSIKVRVECIECLAQIGDTKKLAPLFRKAIDKNKNSAVTKTLSKVFVNWDKSGAKKLSETRFKGKSKLMVSHFSNSLIH